ncbi:MAG: hypothetical protein AB7Y74_12000 [Syntrophorhabdus sp.]
MSRLKFFRDKIIVLFLLRGVNLEFREDQFLVRHCLFQGFLTSLEAGQLLAHRAPQTPVGIVTAANEDDETIVLATLG